MNIRYRRTGGIANIKTQMEFDSDSLPSKQLAVLKKLLKSKSLEKPLHPDDFIYELEVLDGKTLKVRFADSRCNPDARALFDYLSQRRGAETQRKKS